MTRRHNASKIRMRDARVSMCVGCRVSGVVCMCQWHFRLNIYFNIFLAAAHEMDDAFSSPSVLRLCETQGSPIFSWLTPWQSHIKWKNNHFISSACFDQKKKANRKQKKNLVEMNEVDMVWCGGVRSLQAKGQMRHEIENKNQLMPAYVCARAPTFRISDICGMYF